MRRILLINPNTTFSITDQMIAYLRSAISDPIEFVGATGRFGASYISSRAAAAIAGHAALDAMAGNYSDCDAIYLACFGDPGLLAMKELSPIPVIGMAEAACAEATAGGRRFSIVTGGSAWKPMLTEFVQSIGLSQDLASIRVVPMTGDQIAADPDAALASLTGACNECASLDGAEVVILGGAALAGLAAQLQPKVSIPVICSVLAGARAAIRQAAEAARATTVIQPVTSIGLSDSLSALLAKRY
jgi:allantoin racemase